MTSTLRKVNSGDPITIPAATWNAFIDAAVAEKARQQSGGARSKATSRNGSIITVKNDSGAQRDQFDVLGISEPVLARADGETAWRERMALTGITPASSHAGKFAILLEPAPNGTIVKAQAAGVSLARVRMISESHGFADVDAGNATRLASTDSGAATMLWVEPIGERDDPSIAWAVIRFGGTGGGGSSSVERVRVQLYARRELLAGLWAYAFRQVDVTHATRSISLTSSGIASDGALLTQATAIDGDIADLTAPTPGIRLLPDADGDLTFTWDTIDGATNYSLVLSSEDDGAGTVYHTSTAGTTSRTVAASALPGDGSIVYCKLGTEISAAYTYNRYRFYDPEYNGDLAFNRAELTNFDIASADGVMGNDLDTRDGILGSGAFRIMPIGGQPYPWLLPPSADVGGWSLCGNQAIVELVKSPEGIWEFDRANTLGGDCFNPEDVHEYFPDVGLITSPTPGGTLTGTSATFSWSTTIAALEYYIAIGTEPGDGSFDAENRGTNTSFDATGLPDDGSDVWVTLWTRIAAWPYWHFNYYRFTGYTA